MMNFLGLRHMLLIGSLGVLFAKSSATRTTVEQLSFGRIVLNVRYQCPDRDPQATREQGQDQVQEQQAGTPGWLCNLTTIRTRKEIVQRITPDGLLYDNRRARPTGLIEQPADLALRPSDIFQAVVDADPVPDRLTGKNLRAVVC